MLSFGNTVGSTVPAKGADAGLTPLKISKVLSLNIRYELSVVASFEDSDPISNDISVGIVD